MYLSLRKKNKYYPALHAFPHIFVLNCNQNQKQEISYMKLMYVFKSRSDPALPVREEK